MGDHVTQLKYYIINVTPVFLLIYRLHEQSETTYAEGQTTTSLKIFLIFQLAEIGSGFQRQQIHPAAPTPSKSPLCLA